MKESASPATEGRSASVTIANFLPPNHPHRALDGAIRAALAGLPGPWDVAIRLYEGPTLSIAIVAPDASRWTMSCSDLEPLEVILERVRAACSRRRRLEQGRTPMARRRPGTASSSGHSQLRPRRGAQS